MKKSVLLRTAMCFVWLLAARMPGTAQESSPATARTAPPYIVIKVDDLKHNKGRVHARWKRLTGFLQARGIKSSIGIIANSLEGDNPEYVQWIQKTRASGLVEFWNHGYNHREWKEDERTMREFSGPSLEQQKEHLSKANLLAREKLGFAFSTFGAPFNATDAVTVAALQQDTDIKVWLYGDLKQTAGKAVLDRVGRVNIESPTFVPDVEKFKEGYARYPKRDYFVIQGHPAQWDDTRWEQFVKIIDFLSAEKAIFTTPLELCITKGLLSKPLEAAQGDLSAASTTAPSEEKKQKK